tara:strand:+ start:42 stop:983 length:942 start_codon:yes stop_codon:yes gene_type:complete
MFTRVFGKTSFWSYSIALILLLQAIYWHHNLIAETYPNTNLTIKSVIVAFLAIINLVLVEVILRGVLFFHKGNYHLLVFIMFFWILPITEWSIWLWFATLFFWFSVFQIFKLEINESESKGIFNAGFWMVLAILFKPDFYYFYLTLWGALYFKGRLNLKTFFLTLLPICCFFILWQALLALTTNILLIGNSGVTKADFSFLWSDRSEENTGLILILLASFVFVFKHLQGKFQGRKSYKINLKICLLILFSSIFIILLGGERNNVSWISFLMVTAILSAQYLDSVSRKWLVEVFFTLCFCIIFQEQLISWVFLK